MSPTSFSPVTGAEANRSRCTGTVGGEYVVQACETLIKKDGADASWWIPPPSWSIPGTVAGIKPSKTAFFLDVDHYSE